jgi:tetratricopeptide (TPR) repeat protein
VGHEFEEPDREGAEPARNRDKVSRKIRKKGVGGPSKPAHPKSSLHVYVQLLFLFGERILNRMHGFYGSLFDLTQKDKAKIYRNLSVHYINKGEYAKGVELMKEWVRLEPSNPEASYHLAKALASVGNYRSALGVIGKTLRLDPKYKDALYRKGTIHIKLKEYKEAAEALKQFIVLHPNHGSAHYFLAIARDHAGELDKAIETMEKATELDRQSAKFHQHLGFLYGRKGDHQKAAACFSKIMELEQDGEE